MAGQLQLEMCSFSPDRRWSSVRPRLQPHLFRFSAIHRVAILPIASVDKTKKTRSHDPGNRFGTVLGNSRMISIGDLMNDSTNKLGSKALQQVHIGKCDFPKIILSSM